MQRAKAKRRGKRWREKQRKLNIDSCFFRGGGGVEKKVVKLVITHTERRVDKGRESCRAKYR